jgi:hypothetical protein
MASNFEKEPIFLLERRWDDSINLPEKYKFQCRNAKAEVCIDSGTLGMEFFLEKTLAQLNQAGTRLNWSWEETFLEFQNVLGDSYRTTWHEVFNEHFPDPLKEVSTHLRNKKEDFDKPLSSLSRRYLIIESPGTYSISTWPRRRLPPRKGSTYLAARTLTLL